MDTVGDDFPRQQKRVRELIKVYRSLDGGVGEFVRMMENALEQADRAAMSGDIVEILRCYKELKEFE